MDQIFTMRTQPKIYLDPINDLIDWPPLRDLL